MVLLLNGASVDITDDEGSFQFSPEAEFQSPLQQTLKQNHRALHKYCNVKNKLTLLAMKWLLSRLLLETDHRSC